MPFYKLTNTTDGPRGIFTLNGFAVAAPGATISVEAEDADVKANKAFFKAESADANDVVEADTMTEQGYNPRVNPQEPLEVDPNDHLTDEELRDLIEDKTGKRPHHNLGRDKLLAAARG